MKVPSRRTLQGVILPPQSEGQRRKLPTKTCVQILWYKVSWVMGHCGKLDMVRRIDLV